MAKAEEWLDKAVKHGEVMAVNILLNLLEEGGIHREDGELMDRLSAIAHHLHRAKSAQQASGNGVPATTHLLEARILLHMQRRADKMMTNEELICECTRHKRVPQNYGAFAQVTNHVNCSLNHVHCSLNHVHCSLNHVNCSLNHVNCSLWTVVPVLYPLTNLHRMQSLPAIHLDAVLICMLRLR
jgi:hypothetical protein